RTRAVPAPATRVDLHARRGHLSSASSDRYARITSSRLFSEISPCPNPRPSSSRALRIRGIVPVFGDAGAPTITAGRVITTPLPPVGARLDDGEIGATRGGVSDRLRSGSVIRPVW